MRRSRRSVFTFVAGARQRVHAAMSATVLCIAACEPGAGPEPLPWTREVPPEVRAIVHAPVVSSERRASIRIVRELTIGGGGDDLDYLFGERQPHVAVDDTGRLYVTDPTNARLVVYDRAGNHLQTLGRRGQGPGEFSFPIASVVAGRRLFISDSNASRLSRWSLSGELQWDRALTLFPGYLVHPTVGLADGSWLARFRLPRTSTEVVAHLTADGERGAEIAPIEVPGRVGYPPDEPRLMIYAGATPPIFAADTDARVYVSPLVEYQLFAYALDGSMRWALQVPGERPAVGVAEKEWAVGWFREQGYAGARVTEIAWPRHAYALADIKVDGRGRVYAFPYVERGVVHERLPVDVYDPEGNRVVAGWLEGDLEGAYWQGSWKQGPLLVGFWQTASGDHIYGVVEDPGTGVFSVVRYRLELSGT